MLDEVSSTIFKVFIMTRPGIEPRSPGPLAHTLPTRPMNRLKVNYNLDQRNAIRKLIIVINVSLNKFDDMIIVSVPMILLARLTESVCIKPSHQHGQDLRLGQFLKRNMAGLFT